jgi:hypothetical protein
MTLNYLPPLVCQWCGHRTLTVGDTVVCRSCDRPEEARVSYEGENRRMWWVMGAAFAAVLCLAAVVFVLYVLVWP